MGKLVALQTLITKEAGLVRKSAGNLVDKVQSVFVAVESAKLDREDLCAALQTLVTEFQDIRGVNGDKITQYAKACLSGGRITAKKGNVVVKPIKDQTMLFSTKDMPDWMEYARESTPSKPKSRTDYYKVIDKNVVKLLETGMKPEEILSHIAGKLGVEVAESTPTPAVRLAQ